MAALEALSRSKLVSGLRRARSTLSNIKDAAEVGAQRLTIGAAAVGTSYGVARLEGWAVKEGKDITIGDSTVTYPVPVSAAAVLFGAFGGKMLGDTVANIVFGAGVGGLSAEAALLGYKHGTAPDTDS
jgi:hypothetical protein